MPQAVTTPDLRITFVKGVLAGPPAADEVLAGPGTEYPMLVTPDQLAEIFYRVRDGWVTSSTLNVAGADIIATGVAPPDELVFVTANSDCYRGWLFAGDLAAEQAHLLPYYADGYVVTWPPVTDYTVRELNAEPGMWLTPGATTPSSPFDTFGCGLNQTLTTYAAVTGYGVYADPTHPDVTNPDVILEVYFLPEVAYVGSDNPFDPSAQLYVSLQVVVTNADLDSLVSHNTSGLTDTATFALQLAEGDPATCLLYSASTVSGTLTFSAKKWWPYAKNSPPVPLWDAATGLKL